MQVCQRGLQTLCFDLWLNRMNDLRRLAFREQRLAIRLESCHVYTLRGVSGWVCSAEILWENREVTPRLMARVECQVEIRCRTMRRSPSLWWKMSSCLQLERPHRAGWTHFHSAFFHTNHTLHEYPLYCMCCILLSEDSHFIPFFELYCEKSCSLDYGYGVNNNWIQVSLCALLASNSVSPPHKKIASGFQLHSQSAPQSYAPVTGGGMPVEGWKPGVPLKKFLGKSDSGPDLFGMSHGYSFYRACIALD